MRTIEPDELPNGLGRARTTIGKDRQGEKKRVVFRLDFTEDASQVVVLLNGELIYGRG